MLLAQVWTHRLMEGNESSEIQSHMCGDLVYNKNGIFTMKADVYVLRNGAETTE